MRRTCHRIRLYFHKMTSFGEDRKIERRLKQLGIELAIPSSPIGNYVNAVRTGDLLYLAGKGPGLPGKPLPVGKVGRDISKEQAYQHARETGLSLIAVMKAE